MARNTRRLQALPSGTPKAIQNQSGRNPTKWEKTGLVVKVRPHKQVVVKVDGSRRLTLRNRRFIRELDPRKMSLPRAPVTRAHKSTRSRRRPTPYPPPCTELPRTRPVGPVLMGPTIILDKETGDVIDVEQRLGEEGDDV